jgi:hypothetical protein
MVSAGRSAFSYPYPAERQVQVIENQQKILRAPLKGCKQDSNSLAAVVHIRQRLDEKHGTSADFDPARSRKHVGRPFARCFPGKGIENHKSNVVPIPFILFARIPQPDNDFGSCFRRQPFLTTKYTKKQSPFRVFPG